MIEPFLEWFDENQIKQSIKVIDKIFIGRTCKGIDRNKCVIVSHFDVSRDHAEISLINYKLFLIDRSKNGTWVNEVRGGFNFEVQHLTVIWCSAPSSRRISQMGF